jgi:hypothetical protein
MQQPDAPMNQPLFDASVPTFTMFLEAQARLLDKAAASGVPEDRIMAARLAPDMFPFPRQVQIATDMAKLGIARLTDREAPSWPDTEASLAELKERVATALAYVSAVSPASFEGSEARMIEIKASGRDLWFDGAGFLHRFILPNFFFHTTTAYALLRAEGVPLGKPDFFGV